MIATFRQPVTTPPDVVPSTTYRRGFGVVMYFRQRSDIVRAWNAHQ